MLQRMNKQDAYNYKKNSKVVEEWIGCVQERSRLVFCCAAPSWILSTLLINCDGVQWFLLNSVVNIENIHK